MGGAMGSHDRAQRKESEVIGIYVAHISDDGTRTQTYQEHCQNVAHLAAGFAAQFDREAEGERAGLLHDAGKTAQDGQRRILYGGRKVDHATAGAKLLYEHGDPFGAMCVAGHHCGLQDYGSRVASTPHDRTFCGRMQLKPKYDRQVVELPQVENPLELHFDGPEAFRDAFHIRMLYSCLVDADFLDTEAFMLGTARVHHYDGIEVLLSRFHAYIKPWLDQEAESDLNAKRTKILQNCLDKGREVPTGLYSLTVPTGGGKTTASMGFALEHAMATGKRRIIYVIPYTSIIEQNADVFRKILGANNVLEHHASYEGYEGESDEELRMEQLAAENWDAPVVVTTAVQFFESLYGNRSSKLRRIHNIANSVVIFDEAQMLPVEHLIPCVRGIEELVKNYKVTAVLCTATRPSLDAKLTIPMEELQPDRDSLYETLRRTKLQVIPDEKTTEELAGMMAERKQVLCIVNTRQAAKDIYDLLPEEGRYHLSTLMYPAHRRQVLQEIRSKLLDGHTVRLVSTSLIEAGVDVDFPCVMREVSGLDSILQAAGRCNREGREPAESSLVYIFRRTGVTPLSISQNISAFQYVRDHYEELDSLDAVKAYFEDRHRLYGEENMDRDGVVCSFTDPGSYRTTGYSGCLPFAAVAQRFHFISDETRTVYILNDESKQIFDLLAHKNEEQSKENATYASSTRFLYRKLGQYAVSVTQSEFNKYIDTGDIESFEDNAGILVNESLYSMETGLDLKSNAGESLFVRVQGKGCGK